jgi:hypothetical protein
LINQYVLDSLREILPESTSKDIIVPVDKILTEMKLDGIYDNRVQLSKYRELIFMIDDFVRIPKYQLQGTFKDDKGDELRGWRD